MNHEFLKELFAVGKQQFTGDQMAGSVTRAAVKASMNSQFPGRENGPADAYRHMIWAAELTRHYGEDNARAVLRTHETESWMPSQLASDATVMDIGNNEIGIAIGKQAKTWDEIKEIAKERIVNSDGTGKSADDPIWLNQDEWRKNPIDDKTGKEKVTPPQNQWHDLEENLENPEEEKYPHGGKESRYPQYRDTTSGPLSIYQELKKNLDASNGNAVNDNSSGSVHVKSYDRENGTENVRAHTRQPPKK